MKKDSKEQYEFKTEVKQLLDLVIHSLYSHKDIFLRELISNAADAIDKFRLETLTNQELAGAGDDWKIKITTDKTNRQLMISDNGIGMSHEELIDNLGTIAKSGTKAFMEKIKNSNESNLELIGQFGVGFYASFMVADRVEVISRTTASSKAYKWVSTGEGHFEVSETKKDTRGTDVVLFLKKEEDKYLEEYEIKSIIKKYSDFIEHPIVMDIEREEEDDKKNKTKTIKEETINTQKALWTKSKNEITEDEYKEFYKHLSHDYNAPTSIIHYSAEGTIEFKALLYIPAKASNDIFFPDSVKGLQLYVKRIFIMNDCKKLIPEYLRFLWGVVDSSDLPLNVSRELLQQDAQLDKIKKNITGKTLQTLQTMLEKEYDKYLAFFKEFGKVLKEGTHYDFDNKEKILNLCLFETSQTLNGEFKTIKSCIEANKSDKKEIYYILAESRSVAESSPHLEMLKKQNLEVVFMLDPIDEWLVNSVVEYQGYKFVTIDKADLKLETSKEEDKTFTEKENQYKNLLDYMKKQLTNEVKDVKFSKRLTESLACLVNDEFSLSKQMEQMFKNMGQAIPEQKKILELNPGHEVIGTLNELFSTPDSYNKLNDLISLIYDQAVLTEGSKIKDLSHYTKIINQLIMRAGKN